MQRGKIFCKYTAKTIIFEICTINLIREVSNTCQENAGT